MNPQLKKASRRTPDHFRARPSQILCAILTYQEHAQEIPGQNRQVFENPRFILKAPSSITRHSSPVRVPKLESYLPPDDPWGWVTGEVELAVVAGRDAWKVQPAEASRFVDGYTILNDVTQRDLQQRGYPHDMAKSFPTFGPVGPRLVRASRVGDPNHLKLSMRVGSVTVQTGTTSDLVRPVEEIFSLATQLVRLRRGDIVSTGTPKGPFSYRLKHGDVMEAEVEGIGMLRNPVVFEGMSPANRN